MAQRCAIYEGGKGGGEAFPPHARDKEARERTKKYFVLLILISHFKVSLSKSGTGSTS